MLNQKVDFYFAEECVLQAFKDCYSLLFEELNTENAFNLSEKVKIHEINQQLDEYSDSDVFVDCSNLKEQIELIFEAFDVKIESIFISERQVREQIKTIEQQLVDDQEEHDKIQVRLHFNCEKNSELDTLFMIRYARSLKLESVEINEFNTETSIEYSDFDYSELESYIDDYFAESKIIKSYILDHYDSDENTFDIYYKISRISDFF